MFRRYSNAIPESLVRVFLSPLPQYKQPFQLLQLQQMYNILFFIKKMQTVLNRICYQCWQNPIRTSNKLGFLSQKSHNALFLENDDQVT